MHIVYDAFAPPRTGNEAFARFSIAGVDCMVVSLNERCAIPENSIGTFVLKNREYAIVPSISHDGSSDLIELLTPRELEIAILLAAGHETKQIARRLRISFHTVRVHLGRIYAKLNVHKQTELASRVGARFGNGQLETKSEESTEAPRSPEIARSLRGRIIE